MAVFATFVASLAHTIGGGALPGPVALFVALAFSTPIAMVLTGARMRLLRTSAAALIAQAALHLLYAMGGSWREAPAESTMAGHAVHAASAIDIPASVPMVEHGHAAIMPLAHVVAATLTVAFLAAADRAIAAIAVAFGTAVRGIRLVIAVLGGLPVPTRPGSLAATILPDVSPNRETLLLSSLRHRGPPVQVFAA